MDNSQELREVRAIRDIAPVAINYLTEQSDFSHSLRHKGAGLGGDFTNRPRAFHPAPKRYDAERARMRTAVDNGHMRANQSPAVRLR